MADLLEIYNGVAIDRNAIPDLSLDQFGTMLADFVSNDGYVVQFFAFQEADQNRLLAVVRNDRLYVASCPVKDVFPSFTAWFSDKFHLFEREIAEQYGIRPSSHPWLKMVRYHPNWSGKDDIFGNNYSEDIPGPRQYYSIHGETIHEVAVGPVHAGIIEPGHFRFQCAGEEVLHLEIQLGYQHRGVEQLLTGVPLARIPRICEAIAGDTAIGHNLCCCQAIESLANISVAPEIARVRAMALEIERIANHLGDLGALSGDVAFNPPAAYFGRMRGDFLNLLQCLSGNRFGKGLLNPGGIAYPFGPEQKQLISDKLNEITPQIVHVCDLLFGAHTVQARFEQTGRLSLSQAQSLGLVGYAGRACGLAYDVRSAFPTPPYATLPRCEITTTSGDVLSRALVRRDEIMHSISLIRTLLEQTDLAPSILADASPHIGAHSFVVSLIEGWRGEISHCILTDEAGNISRYKVKDPSFHNWTGLAMALRNQEISDFPLCNKSFNLSYCGFDL